MEIIARICPVSCSCEFRGELFFCEREGWERPCPSCGKTLTPSSRKGERFYGNRRFAGEEAVSISHHVEPGQIKAVRKAGVTAGLIHDDGRVEFADRSDERTFNRQWDQYQNTRAGVLDPR